MNPTLTPRNGVFDNNREYEAARDAMTPGERAGERYRAERNGERWALKEMVEEE